MLKRISILRVTFVLCALMQDQCGLRTESLHGLHVMEFGPGRQSTRLARSFQSAHQMNEGKTIHPELMVMRTITNITGGFLYGINRPQDGYLRAYDHCVEWAQRDSQTKAIFGPNFKWTVEKFNLSLPCSKCVPNEAEVSWQFISPEDVKEDLQVWRRSRRLEIRDLRQSNTGHYVCKWRYNDILAVGSVTTIEIIQSDDLHVVNWKNYNNEYQQTDLEWGNLRIFTQWTDWSACNKCNRVGKRHKFGICMVQLIESARQSNWDALSSYADRTISCSMLLNLYPEMEAENETLSKYLEQPPKIMVAYCKVECNQETARNDKEFEKLPSEIRELYLYETFANQDNVILGFIPNITETTVAEILCVAFLLFLQAYIVYHTCKYKQKKALKRAKQLHRDDEENLNNAKVKNVAVQYEQLLTSQSSQTDLDTDYLTEET